MDGGQFRVSRLPLGQFLFLFTLGRRFALSLKADLAPVQEAVVDLAAHVKGLLEFGLLCGCGIEPVFECALDDWHILKSWRVLPDRPATRNAFAKIFTPPLPT